MSLTSRNNVAFDERVPDQLLSVLIQRAVNWQFSLKSRNPFFFLLSLVLWPPQHDRNQTRTHVDRTPKESGDADAANSVVCLLRQVRYAAVRRDCVSTTACGNAVVWKAQAATATGSSLQGVRIHQGNHRCQAPLHLNVFTVPSATSFGPHRFVKVRGWCEIGKECLSRRGKGA